MRYGFLLPLTAVIVLSGAVSAQTAQPEPSTIQLAPIVATLPGWDTGITVVNTTDKPLTVTNFVFYSTTGEVKTATGKSFTVPAFGRFSKLASELVGTGMNGSMKFSVIGPGAKKAKAYQALYSSDLSTVDTIIAQELAASFPFAGSMTGVAKLVFGDTECPSGVRTITTASGNLSDLGRVEALFSHCPAPPGTTLPTTNGRMTLVLDNRDEIWATYEDSDGQPPFEGRIQGGTGRFKSAEGTTSVDWKIQPALDPNGNPIWTAPIPWWANVKGSIRY